MKEFNTAIDYYDIALKIDENFPMALAYKGLALGELGEIDNALHFFKAALSIDIDYDVALEGKESVTNILKSKN